MLSWPGPRLVGQQSKVKICSLPTIGMCLPAFCAVRLCTVLTGDALRARHYLAVFLWSPYLETPLESIRYR